jgi:cyclopropane fatty-acyl-phospholipid synthase-like methyltransferase
MLGHRNFWLSGERRESNQRINLVSTTFYTEEFNSRADVSERSAHRVVSELLQLMTPKIVVDFGCGVGTRLRVFLAEGVSDMTGPSPQGGSSIL